MKAKEKGGAKKPKKSGSIKEKATMDQNGQGTAPKYGKAGKDSNETTKPEKSKKPKG